MRVIEQGQHNLTFTKRCPYCDALLEYTKEDITRKRSLFFDFCYITCAECNNDIDVPERRNLFEK